MREIRRARAGDVPLVARVLEMAGRGHLPRGPWDLMFPDDAERGRALEGIAGGEPSWCQVGVFRVAEQDGVPGAALCAFEPGKLGGTQLAGPLARVFTELGIPNERLAGVGPLLATYLRCFPEMPDGTWIVENVGALPEARRRGLVGALLDAALEDGRRAGYAQAQISCLIGNDAAHRAYERVGFRVVEAREDAEFEALLGAPGFVRMRLAL
jgi:ribosomal protein S18 acetylase RimI-like enzyme